MASSVCGLVGLAPTDVELRAVVVVAPPMALLVVVAPGGWCRSRNLVLEPVMKQEMWEVKNLSITFRYLVGEDY